MADKTALDKVITLLDEAADQDFELGNIQFAQGIEFAKRCLNEHRAELEPRPLRFKAIKKGGEGGGSFWQVFCIDTGMFFCNVNYKNDIEIVVEDLIKPLGLPCVFVKDGDTDATT